MGWPTYIHNLGKDDLVKLAKHWNVPFEEDKATVPDLRVHLKTFAKSHTKEESDVPPEIDPSYLVLFRARTPSPQPQQNQFAFPPVTTTVSTPPTVTMSTTATTSTNADIAQLCNLVKTLLTVPQTHVTPSTPTSPAASSTQTVVVDRDRRVKNVEETCEKQGIQFSGLPGDNVKLFIIKLEEVFKLFPVKDNEIFRVLFKVTLGPANVHLKLNPQLYTNWKDAKDILIQNFLTDSYDTDAKIALLGRRQRINEPIAIFIGEVNLLNKCLVTPLAEPELIKLIVKNVNPEYYRDVRGRVFNSLDEIRRVGQTLENQWYEKECYELANRIASSSTTERTDNRRMECYGCGTPEKTLKSCTCETAIRYQTKAHRERSPSSHRRNVTFDRNVKSPEHSPRLSRRDGLQQSENDNETS